MATSAMVTSAQQTSQASSSGVVGSTVAQSVSQSTGIMASQVAVLTLEDVAIQQAALQEAQLQRALGDIKAEKEKMIRRRARMQRRGADIEDDGPDEQDDDVRAVRRALLGVIEMQEHQTTILQDIQQSLDILAGCAQAAPSPTGPGAWPVPYPPFSVPPVTGVSPYVAPSSIAIVSLGMPLSGGVTTGSSLQVPFQTVYTQTPSQVAVTTQPAVSQIVQPHDTQPQQLAQQPVSPGPQPRMVQGPGQTQWVPKTAIATPKPFTGDKRGEDLDTWLRSVPVYVRCKLTLPHEEVLVAASYLKGSAARWLSGLVQLQGYGHDFRAWAATQKLDDFLKMVEERWHDPQEAQRATDAILILHTRQFKSVREATDDVEHLICVPGVRYDPQVLLTSYLRCFSQPLRNKLAKEANINMHNFPSFSKASLMSFATNSSVEKGWIRPSVSPYGSLVLFVSKKKEGTLRMCIDYKGLNAITVKNIAFGRTRVLYLGHEISAEGLNPDDAKVASIRDWPRPQSVTEMRSFLGMTDYYRTFVKNYSIVAAPLTDLTRLDTPWEWTDECEAAFTHLKHALTHYEVLKLPDPDKPFIVTTDASQYGIGAVLAQQERPKLRPIEYMSKKMSSQKLPKSTYEKELYVVYKALTHWRHYLLGRFFILRTDHQTLRWMRTQPVLSDALKRWIEVIEQYDFDPQYLKGEYNKVADALSRRPDFSDAELQRFWWPTMMRDASLYVETCQVCQRDKPCTQAPLGLLKPLPIPERPGESLSMDFMDTLITSKSGMRHIFVIVDRFSKYARLVAMSETARTEYVIRMFKQNWVRDFGLPKSIISDRDVRFTSELWKAAAAEQGTQLQMTSGNHPEANGQAEQLNRVVQHLLRHYIEPNQVDWDEKLALIASLYNNAVHSATGEHGISRKLMPQYFGPWEVLDIVGTDPDVPSYVIRIPGHLRTYPVFHASKLAPFKDTDQFPSRRSMLPPTMYGEVDIDDIVDHIELPVARPAGRGRPPKPKLQYRVRFRHHTDPKEDRWLTREELMQTAPQVVTQYEGSLQKGKRPMIED
ncbi:hypothetical protein CBR_g27817 [Chara braunii]|uniref:Integrase catalytic domain-containing protein n=1 Tax=Chara braunii TaxID=69332 RepID=A0A388L8M4_CHABU|nr:hypothetical protein CBR_g27817 [Chara braunii]|eukprot:GBG78592.1 hypothetical protein CBR_g27817 [Chara braunii]